MAFTVAGTIDGTYVRLEYDPASPGFDPVLFVHPEVADLAGDIEFAFAVDRTLGAEGVPVTVTGPTIPASLADPFSALCTLTASLSRVLGVAGDVPDPPAEIAAASRVPEGAQA